MVADGFSESADGSDEPDKRTSPLTGHAPSHMPQGKLRGFLGLREFRQHIKLAGL